MRTIGALVLVVGCALLGCGGSSSATDAAVPQDLSAQSDDLAAPQSCAQVYACTTGCATPACTGQCAAGGTSAAQSLFESLYECAYAQCLSDAGVSTDGGAASCASLSDETAGCNACLHDAELSPACSTPLASCVSS